ncbi:MAG: sigma-70 family RNA polymerase sigma factor [Planctomycetaceae bacterium]|nr:sigma-70 family RNA polymerase sigma factor [Planctomycetaceae bacterium]
MKPIPFQTTHWSVVLAAKGDDTKAKAALQELCESYRAPILRYVERVVRTDSPQRYGSRNAEDLTHDFLVRLLEGKMFGHLQRREGRDGCFRAYLLGAVRHFLSNVRQREKPFDRYSVPIPDEILQIEDDDAIFDHDWAQTTIDRAIVSLGDAPETQTLLPYLTRELTAEDRERLTAKLDKSETAVKVALHRLRKKFREAVRKQIACTVESESEIAAELDHLIRAL